MHILTGASRAARLALQKYGAVSMAAGGVIVVSSSSERWKCGGVGHRQHQWWWESARAYDPFHFLKYGLCHNTDCEAIKKPPKKVDDAATIRRRMTNVGRFSLLSETSTNPSVPVLVLCLRGEPWTARDFVNLYQTREIGSKHERFRSVMDGDHFVAPHEEEPASSVAKSNVRDMLAYPQIHRNELKSMITDALLTPMDLSKGLWEAWVGTGGAVGQSGATPSSSSSSVKTSQNNEVESLLLFRAHHCMADGVSLGAIFGDFMDEGEDFRAMIKEQVNSFRKRKRSWWQKLQLFLYYWCWGSIKAVAYQIHLYFHSTFLSSPNPWTALQKGAAAATNEAGQVRTLSWVQIATVQEAKQVADFFTKQHKNESKRQKMTINDIFCSCVTGATAKLMAYHRQKQDNPDLVLPHLNLVIPVHMAGGVMLPGSPLGNKIGAMVNQVPAEKSNSASERLHLVHQTLWERKQTPAAALSFVVANVFGGTLGSILGKSMTSWLFTKAHANASVVVTNVRGPEKAAHLDGRTVEANLGFLPLPPGVPLGLVVTSYNQRITLTVMAESWAVPDADEFLSWVVEEYQELLNEVRRGQ